MTPRPYHHGDLRAALLEQAERTVREHGADELSLRELARQVGVSHSAPRRHFADRQALRNALAEAGFERLGAELQSAVDTAGEDFAARLRATALAYVRFATEDAALLDLMFISKHHTDSETLDEAVERAFSAILDLILQGQAAGLLEHQGDPERVGLLLFSTMQGIAALLSRGMIPAERVDQLVGDAVAQFLR